MLLNVHKKLKNITHNIKHYCYLSDIVELFFVHISNFSVHGKVAFFTPFIIIMLGVSLYCVNALLNYK